MIAGRSTLFFYLFALVVAFLLSGCAGLMTSQPPSEETLRLRVEQLLEAKTTDDWAKVYSLYDSAYRKKISLMNFVNRPQTMHFSGAELVDITLDPSGLSAQVKVISSSTVQGFDFKKIPSTQQWLVEDGNWYCKIPDPKALFSNK